MRDMPATGRSLLARIAYGIPHEVDGGMNSSVRHPVLWR